MRAVTYLIGVLILPALGYSATYYVPDDYGTIQAAIDAATAGDSIVVRPGTYYENINLLGKYIALRSQEGAADTWIDGSRAGSVVTCSSGESSGVLLKGFTLYNGMATYGGGMYNNDFSSPTVMIG